jgi:hypothetical protein
MNDEIIKQINELQKDMVNAWKVYENKMGKIWDRMNKLKKEIRDGTKI